MTATDVLQLVCAAGVELEAADDGLHRRSHCPLSEDLRQLLLSHKGELLLLLAKKELQVLPELHGGEIFIGQASPSLSDRPHRPSPSPWDQKVADDLLSRLRDYATHLEQESAAGRVPQVKADVAQVWLEMAEAKASQRNIEEIAGCFRLAGLKTVQAGFAEIGTAVTDVQQGHP